MSNTYTRQPDGTWLDVEIHQIVDNTTLEIVLDTVDDTLLADIHKLQICQVILRLVNSLVDLLIIGDTVTEILCSLLGVHSDVVWGGCLDFQDIAHDKVLVVALGLDIHGLNTGLVTFCLDPAAARLGRVSSIEDCNDSAILEPDEHVRHSSLSRSTSHSLSFAITSIEEVCSGLRGVIATVVSNVEDLRVNGEPLEVALSYKSHKLDLSLPAKS